MKGIVGKKKIYCDLTSRLLMDTEVFLNLLLLKTILSVTNNFGDQSCLYILRCLFTAL